MPQKDTGGNKLPKNLRLFSKKEKASLRPDADKQSNDTTQTPATKPNLVGQRADTDTDSNIEFDTSVDPVVSRSEIKFEASQKAPGVGKEQVSPTEKAFTKESEKNNPQNPETRHKTKSDTKQESSNTQNNSHHTTSRQPASTKATTVAATVPASLEKVVTKTHPKPEVKKQVKKQEKSKREVPSNESSKPVSKSTAKTTPKHVTASKSHTAPKNTEIGAKSPKPTKPPTKNNSNLTHVFTGIMIACVMLTLAFLWPYLPFNREQIVLPGQETGDTIREMVLGESEIDEIDGELQLDENGFAIIDEIDDEALAQQEVLEPVLAQQDTPPVVDTTPPQEPEVLIEEPIVDTTPIVVDPPTVTQTPDPVVYVAPTNTVGEWGLVNLNTETFDIDDEDDDVTQLYLKDVCKSVYRQNSNAFDYCRETSKLKKSTSEDVGRDKCDGGGSCRVGDTCLLWNSDEEDDGDLKSYTATYLCE